MKGGGKLKVRELTFAALFAALTAAAAFLRIPLGPVAVTPQFLITAMAGVILGAKWGAVSQGLYVALGLVGLPLFTMGGGFGYILQPTFGFLLGLIAAAAVIGGITKGRAAPRRILLAALAGLAVLYLIGLPYMALIYSTYLHQDIPFGKLMMLGCIPFLPFDAAKILLTAALCPILQKRLNH